MKLILVTAILLLSDCLYGQAIDSVAIKQLDSLILLSRSLTSEHHFEDALDAITKAETIAQEKFGKSSLEYGSVSFNFGRLYYFAGEFDESEKWYLKSKYIRESKLEKKDQDNIAIMFNLGTLYAAMGHFNKAEEHYLVLKGIVENEFGDQHPFYSMILNNLGTLYKDIQLFDKAELLLNENIILNEKLYGKSNLEYAIAISNMANLYMEIGKIEEAEKLFMEAKPVWEELGGDSHPGYVILLENLAELNLKKGNFSQTESYILTSLKIRERTLGKAHHLYALDLNNLATFYTMLREYEKSDAKFIEALRILENGIGKENPEYAECLLEYGLNNINLGKYELAKNNIIEATNITQNVLGKAHLLYATCFSYLAIYYYVLNDFDKAEFNFLHALRIIETKVGQFHPYYFRNLKNLAKIYQQSGKLELSKKLLEEAKNYAEITLGIEHPHYIDFLHDMAWVTWQIGLFDESINYLFNARSLERALIMKASTYMSEYELTTYIRNFSERLSWDFSIAHTQSKITAENYNNIIFYKGFISSSILKLNKLATSDSLAVLKYNELKYLRRRLAKEYSKQIDERKNVAELEEKTNTTEKELARSFDGYAEALRQVKWQEIQATLKKDEVAMEFVQFVIKFPQLSDSVMYAALLITSESHQPIFVPLFEEKELTKKLTGKKEAQSNELVAQIYTRGLVPLGTRTNHEGLYDLCWKPLDSLLIGVKKIYYSPSGILNQINFDAIPAGFDANDEVLTLGDKYALVRLGSTRSIVIPDATTINTSNEIVLYGGIQYEMDTTINFIIDSINQENSSYSSGFEVALRSLPSRGRNWNYLPGTEVEISEIKRIGESVQFPVSVYQGNTATEEKVKEIGSGKASPRILHFATHGFFFPDPERTAKAASSSFLFESEKEPVFKSSDNPMIRSGLILAGGNYAWQHGRAPRPDMEDGILTAYEISQMNLSNTELVVLSACETGLGDIQGNEGVYGLQRAFKIAGAKYLIMSLWQVPDRETMEFMTTFYKNWLEEKMTIPDAFRKTQREMRDRFFNPYSWAGFVLVE